ncbi:MAG: ABC transporter ATP-binding protein, partial [Anaerolineales bacterium]|nr:ABC transporter ATP-binding protein [Anaerolineales bacterium]
MAEPILTVKDLRKRFGEFEAVQGVSFCMVRGEIFSLLGPNGAGKTTTISMLSTLLRPSSGEVVVNGRSLLTDPQAAKQAIGVVPQEIALYDALSARQNLHFWGRMYGMGGGALKERVEEVLTQVDLRDRADDR